MSVVEELIKTDPSGISFGNYELDKKTKRDGFEYEGNLYKIKTYREITRLEKNDTLLYESVPGSAVHNFETDGSMVSFTVEGKGDIQITLGMEDDTEYDLVINGKDAGRIKTSMGGKLSFSVDLEHGNTAEIKVTVVG